MADLRVDTPPMLPARFDSPYYHVDPYTNAVNQTDGYMRCYGPVFIDRESENLLNAEVYFHTDGFTAVQQANRVMGILKVRAWMEHSTAAYFATIEKHWNFWFRADYPVETLSFPTTPVYTSSPSRQTGESLTLAITAVASLGQGTYKKGGDFVVAANFALGSGDKSGERYSMTYDLELIRLGSGVAPPDPPPPPPPPPPA